MSRQLVQFGAYELDSAAGELRKHGIKIKLQEQPLQILQKLLERPGEVVTREELQKRIWPADTFVDFDHGLYSAVQRLRDALGDNAETPRYIETIPRRGYRFIAAADTPNGHGSETKNATLPVEIDVPLESHRPDGAGGRWYSGFWLAGAALMFALVFVSNTGGLRTRMFSSSTPTIRSLAVLPLQNLSGDPNQDYFADGMTEELITELCRLNAVKVISRTSIMRYKNSNKSLPIIARELGVDVIVEGSVLRSGDRVRITAQLISAQTDANLWADTYDRNLQDTLAVQAAVASAIAGKIKTTMISRATMQTKVPRVVNLKAHEAYLLGAHEDSLAGEFANHRGMTAVSEEHHRRAIEYYEQALQADPNYAPLYLAIVSNSEDPNEVEEKLKKALELDDTLSGAHLELAAVLLTRDLNWQGAEKEFLRAIESNPNNAAAHQGYAYFLDAAGRLDDGMKEYHRAQELDPSNDHLGAALYSRREYHRLIELERQALATNPPGNNSANAIAHKVLMLAYARVGKRKESIEEFRSAMVCMGFDSLAEEMRRGYLKSGYEGALRAYLSGLKRYPDWKIRFVDTYAYTELGDYDRAFARLPHLSDQGGIWQWVQDPQGVLAFPSIVTLRIEPMWDPLHSDPRFDALARRLGLPAAESSTDTTN
jgi:TolB-like protein/DNA-binding winged helix-turn-helix (wHTH) protein